MTVDECYGKCVLQLGSKVSNACEGDASVRAAAAPTKSMCSNSRHLPLCPWHALHPGELRAIGEVMIQERTYDDDTHVGPNLTVLGFAEFVRRQSAKPPGGGREGCVEAEEWGRSKEKMQQVGQLRSCSTHGRGQAQNIMGFFSLRPAWGPPTPRHQGGAGAGGAADRTEARTVMQCRRGFKLLPRRTRCPR